MRRAVACLLVGSLALASCGDDAEPATTDAPTSRPAPGDPPTTTSATPPTDPPATTEPESEVARPGAAVLAERGFDILHDRRVGLIANQTSLVGDERLIDLLAAHPNVELAAVFAPEHGIDGAADAGELFGDTVDEATGVPVVSMYDQPERRIPAAMLADIDVLVFDLQDVGARYYTYVSTMGLAMETAAATGTSFVVLDRPNPLGGDLVSGFTRTPDQESFIAPFPVPAVHGMTAGELSRAIVGEGWMSVAGIDLTVVEVESWRRSARWPDTGLEWVPPSPGLPAFANTETYPATVSFETSTGSYGRGTHDVFTIVGAPWADGAGLVADLSSRGLDGVRFEATSFTPEILAIAPSPAFLGVTLEGVRLVVTDPTTFDPVAAGVHLLEAAQRQASTAGTPVIEAGREEYFDLLAGTTRLREMLLAGDPANEIVDAWSDEVAAFRELREPYLIYD